MECPNCKEHQFVRVGFRVSRIGKRQRWQCKNCGRTVYEAGGKIQSP